MQLPDIRLDARERIFYNGKIVGYLKDRCAIVDKRYATDFMRVWLTRRQGYTVFWRDDVVLRFTSDAGPAMQPLPKRVRLWQLCPDALLALHFLDYQQLVSQYGEPDPNDYRCVFDEDLATDNPTAICDILGSDYSIGPDARELSVSDVLELYSEDGSSYHYISTDGLREIAFCPMTYPQIISAQWQIFIR